MTPLHPRTTAAYDAFARTSGVAPIAPSSAGANHAPIAPTGTATTSASAIA